MLHNLYRAGALCLALLVMSSARSATPLEQVSLLATGVRDSAAVVRTADQQLVVLKPGDSVPGTRAVVLKVAADKLVLEETDAAGQQRQLVWLYKANSDAQGRIERFADHVAAPALPRPPDTVQLRLPGGAAGAARSAQP